MSKKMNPLTALSFPTFLFLLKTEFRDREGLSVWCCQQDLHRHRQFSCRHAVLWIVLRYDWCGHWCLLHLWVSKKILWFSSILIPHPRLHWLSHVCYSVWRCVVPQFEGGWWRQCLWQGVHGHHQTQQHHCAVSERGHQVPGPGLHPARRKLWAQR